MKNRRPLLLLAFLSLLVQVPAQAGRDKTFDYSGKGPELFDYAQVISSDGLTVTTRPTSRIPKLLGVSNTNVLGEWYAGYSTAGDLLDLSGNSRDLADTVATPTLESSSLIGGDGNQLQSFFYNELGSHNLVHADWMNVFDGDFAMTFLIKTPSTVPGVNKYFFGHGSGNADGGYASFTTAGVFTFILSKAGSLVQPTSGTTSYVDGNYHLVHVVRSADYATVYVDGQAGAPLNCAGYGIDAARTLVLGGSSVPAWPGSIAYTRLQNSALTFTQIQKEVGLFQGNLASRSGGQLLLPTFQRTTSGTTTGVSTVERKTGTYSLAQVPQNWPVKSSDGATLVESSTTQILTYTGAFSTSWLKTRSSISATSVTLPDGTTGTTNTLKEDDTATNTHHLSYPYSATTGTSYTWSIYVKYNSSAAIPREWIQIYMHDSTKSVAQNYNIRYGYKGSYGGTLATKGSGIQPVANGWYRIWVWGTAENTASGVVVLYVAEGDNDTTIDVVNPGGQDSVFIANPQLQTGAFPTSYVAQPAAAGAIRAADNMTFIPWRISDDLASKVNSTPLVLFTGGESLNGATVTPTVGAGYPFTKVGRPQNLETYSEGSSFAMNGTTDYLSSSNAAFNPPAEYSVVFVFTPTAIPSNIRLMGKATWSATERGWEINQQTDDVVGTVSADGNSDGGIVVTVSNCLEIGKPVLVTFTVSASSGVALRVDAFTPATNATPAPTWNSTNDFKIGGYTSTNLTGRLLYYAYYPNYLVTATEHDNMYAAFKMDGVLPLNISSTAAKKKLVVECEVKGQYASAADNGGQYRSFLSIGGAYGTSNTTRNNFYLQSTANGSSYAVLHTDGSVTDRYIYSAVRTDHDKWTRHKWVVDTSDLSLSTYSINGVLQTGFTQMTGTAEFGLRDTLIRFGQGGTGTILGNMEIRNVKLGAE